MEQLRNQREILFSIRKNVTIALKKNKEATKQRKMMIATMIPLFEPEHMKNERLQNFYDASLNYFHCLKQFIADLDHNTEEVEDMDLDSFVKHHLLNLEESYYSDLDTNSQGTRS
jgi:hypothetical protein